MKYQRIINEFPLDTLTGADEGFRKLTRIDPNDPNSGFAADVEQARRMIIDHCTACSVSCRYAITDKSDRGLTLETGHLLTGSMLAEVFAEADELYAYVTTLRGYDDLAPDDVMMQFLVDAWGTALVSCAQSAFCRVIADDLAQEDRIRSNTWGPGEFGIDIANQTVLFELLHPEDNGVTLKESLLMIPLKSCSGILGVLPKTVTKMPRPCDYCQFRSTCSGHHSDCRM